MHNHILHIRFKERYKPWQIEQNVDDRNEYQFLSDCVLFGFVISATFYFHSVTFLSNRKVVDP